MSWMCSTQNHPLVVCPRQKTLFFLSPDYEFLASLFFRLTHEIPFGQTVLLFMFVALPKETKSEVIKFFEDAFRNCEKDIIYIGRILRTESIKISLPPNEKFLSF